MTTPTLEEMKTKVYNLVKEVNIQKPFEDVTGEPHYVTEEIMKIVTTAKREALREVQSTIMSMKPYPTEPRMHQSYNDGKRDLADNIITHLESELTI